MEAVARTRSGCGLWLEGCSGALLRAVGLLKKREVCVCGLGCSVATVCAWLG